MRTETIVNKQRYAYTLEALVRMFVDYDHIGSREWDEEYAEKVAVLAQHFDMPHESTVLDTLREAMAVVLHTGKPLDILTDETITAED